MKILFVGESWLGSSARSLREALARRPDIELAEVNVDHVAPNARGLALRLANRLLGPLQIKELEAAVTLAVATFRPDCVLFYKGWHFSRAYLAGLKAGGPFIANVFPDCSPHAHGRRLARAMGVYDLVISTKSFHPALWASTYHYSNRCVFVPHGYDPWVHLRQAPSATEDIDVALVATGRAEYHALIRELAARLGGEGLEMAIAGSAWRPLVGKLPKGWRLVGPRHGPDYIELIQRAKIILAPLQRQVEVDGRLQPGDGETTRTYELAAAHCFFIHRSTDDISMLYNPYTECPQYESAADLAEQIRFYLPNADLRRAIAAAAHARAVPAYSLDQRAADIVKHLTAALTRADDASEPPHRPPAARQTAASGSEDR
jgi:hypothetical protein